MGSGVEGPGLGVEGGEDGDVAVGSDAEVAEASGGDEESGFEGGDRLVVGGDGGVESGAHGGQVVGEDPDAVVKFASKIGNGLGVAGGLFLSPSIGHGSQEGNEGGGGGQEDFAVSSGFDEGWVLFKGGAEEVFAREKEDDEFGRGLELVPVGLGGEPLDVLSDVSGVGAEFLAALKVGVGLLGVEVGVEGAFGVDDHLSVAGEADDEVGSEPAVVGGGGGLLVEVAVFEHAGQFDDALELDFAPASADLWGAEGLDEAGGFAVEFLLGDGEGPELFGETGVLGGAFGFPTGEALVHLMDGFAEGDEEGFETCALLFEVGFEEGESGVAFFGGGAAELFTVQLIAEGVLAVEGGLELLLGVGELLVAGGKAFGEEGGAGAEPSGGDGGAKEEAGGQTDEEGDQGFRGHGDGIERGKGKVES